MRGRSVLVLVFVFAVATLGCSKRQTSTQTVRVPPRIDLKQLEMIGVIDFDASSDGELGLLATRRFTESARRDQGMVRIVDFGSEADALRSVAGDELNPATFRALGKEHGVLTILTGELAISEIRPNVSIASSLKSGSLSATVDATLAVQLIEAATGASLWSTSASATTSVGHISVLGSRDFVFDAEDPEQAYGALVDSLVEQVTQEFHVTWERR